MRFLNFFKDWFYKISKDSGNYYENSNKPDPEKFYWLLLIISCLLFILGKWLQIKLLIGCIVMNIILAIIGILYIKKILPEYKFLDRLVSPIGMALILANQLTILVPFEFWIPIRFILFAGLTLYFTGKLNIFKALLMSVSTLIIKYFVMLSDYKIGPLNMNNTFFDLILREDFSDKVPENGNYQENNSKFNRACLEIPNNRTYKELEEIGESVQAKMGDRLLIEKPNKGAHYETMFSFAEHAFIKFIMFGYEDKIVSHCHYNETVYKTQNRYGTWLTSGDAQSQDALHIYGPLSHQSKFRKEYITRFNAFKINNKNNIT